MREELTDPGPLTDGEVTLRLREITAADPARDWLPAYRFDIVVRTVEEPVGDVELRVGFTSDVVRYGGHVAYGVDPAYRGHRYATKASRLLLPLALVHGMDVLWITCNPENVASRRTCLGLGGELVDIVDLPPRSDMYREGDRRKCRYRIVVQKACEDEVAEAMRT